VGPQGRGLPPLKCDEARMMTDDGRISVPMQTMEGGTVSITRPPPLGIPTRASTLSLKEILPLDGSCSSSSTNPQAPGES
jgi:hypothetical protein